MKLYRTFVGISVLGFASLAGAAEFTHSLHVNVPFSFVVGGEQFKPGAYNVKEAENGVITVEGQGKSVAVISTPSHASKTGEVSSLLFTNTAKGQYLSGVAVEGFGSRALTVHAPKRSDLALSARSAR